MKYSFTFKFVMFIGIMLGGFAFEAYLENLPTLCACMCSISFFFIWGASMAPDHEKYSDEYKKRKGL